MKNTFAIFLIFIFSNLYSQEQYSDISNVKKTLNSIGMGFVQYEGIQYLINRELLQTKVYTISENGGLSLVNNIKHRPTFGETYIIGNSLSNNSGIIVKDRIMAEAYKNHIYLIDFISGELKDIISIPEFNIVQSSYLDFIGENLIINTRNSNGQLQLFKYNTITRDIIKLNLDYDFPIYRLKKSYCQLKNNNVLILDIELNKIDTIYTLIETSTFVKNFYSENNFQVGIVTENKVLHINEEGNLIEYFISKSNITDLIIKEDVIGFIENNTDISLYNKEPSLLKIFENQSASNILFNELKNLPKNIISFYTPGDYFSIGDFKFFDINQNEIITFEIYLDRIFAFENINENGKYYILGYDDIELYGFPYRVFELDFTSKTSHQIHFYYNSENLIRNGNIIMAESFQNNKINFLGFSFDGEADIWNYNYENKTNTKIQSILHDKNFGVGNLEYTKSIPSTDLMVSSTNIGIYHVDENKVGQIDTQSTSSPFAYDSENIYYFNSDGTNYFKNKYNFKSNSLEKIKLDNITFLYQTLATKNLIAVQQRYLKKYDDYKSFYDINEGKFFALLDENNKEIRPNSINQSGNNLCITQFISQNNGGSYRNYYHYNTISKYKLKIPLHGFFDVFPSANQGFLLSRDTNHYLINNNGKIVDSLKTSKIAREYYVDNNQAVNHDLSGKIFDYGDTILLVCVKDEKLYATYIPNLGTKYYIGLYWKKIDDHFIFETNYNSGKATVLYTFGNSPIIINTTNSNESLIETILLGDKLILMYYNSLTNTSKAFNFDIIKRSLEEGGVFNCINPRINLEITSSVKLHDSTFVFLNNDGVHGREIWKYDITNKKAEILKDLNDNFSSSNPSEFLLFNDYILFTASTIDNSFQWFRLMKSTNNVIDIESKIITIYPNPSSNEISINKDLKEISLYDLTGKKYFQKYNYKYGEKLDLPKVSGTYIINAKDSFGNSFSQKVIKVN